MVIWIFIIGDQSYYETCGDGNFDNFGVVKWWKEDKYIGKMVIQGGVWDSPIQGVTSIVIGYHTCL